jgi:hypothetical protein
MRRPLSGQSGDRTDFRFGAVYHLVFSIPVLQRSSRTSKRHHFNPISVTIQKNSCLVCSQKADLYARKVLAFDSKYKCLVTFDSGVPFIKSHALHF